jgi:azurin
MTATVLSLVLATPLLLSPAPAAAQATEKKAPAKADTAKKADAAKAAPTKAGAARTIDITGGDNMQFNLKTITAKPGETIRVQLKNVGTMPKIAMAHNFVVLKPTVKPDEFANAAMMARDTDFIPAAKKADIVANTSLAGPGETVEITFKVPAAGSYPFLCSFAGHFAAGMKGTLEVK